MCVFTVADTRLKTTSGGWLQDTEKSSALKVRDTWRLCISNWMDPSRTLLILQDSTSIGRSKSFGARDVTRTLWHLDQRDQTPDKSAERWWQLTQHDGRRARLNYFIKWKLFWQLIIFEIIQEWWVYERRQSWLSIAARDFLKCCMIVYGVTSSEKFTCVNMVSCTPMFHLSCCCVMWCCCCCCVCLSFPWSDVSYVHSNCDSVPDDFW